QLAQRKALQRQLAENRDRLLLFGTRMQFEFGSAAFGEVKQDTGQTLAAGRFGWQARALHAEGDKAFIWMKIIQIRIDSGEIAMCGILQQRAAGRGQRFQKRLEVRGSKHDLCAARELADAI